MFSFFKKRLPKKEQPVVEVVSSGRRTGRTTRIVDKLIQDLFDNGACYFYDHFPTNDAKMNVHSIIINRLKNEHGITSKDLKVDLRNNIITYERNTRA